MDRDEFVDRFKHEVFGLILDAVVVQRTGPELSIFLKGVSARTEGKLGEIYDFLAAELAKKPRTPQRM